MSDCVHRRLSPHLAVGLCWWWFCGSHSLSLDSPRVKNGFYIFRELYKSKQNVTKSIYGLQRPRYFLSGSLQKKLTDAWSKGSNKHTSLYPAISSSARITSFGVLYLPHPSSEGTATMHVRPASSNPQRHTFLPEAHYVKTSSQFQDFYRWKAYGILMV